MNNKDNFKDSIGIMTWYNHCNCGGNLQAYALKNVLNKLNYKVTFINYVGQNKDYVAIFKRKIRRFVSGYVMSYAVWGFDKFQKKYLPETKPISKSDLMMLNERFDIFVSGSDQIWAPTLYDSAYFLDFVNEGKRKIAYAPSIGLNYIPEELISSYAQLLYGFDYISVREKTAEILLREKCGIESCTTLDPTLLLEKKDYELLEESFEIEGDYIFCYFLNQNNWYSDIIKKIAIENKCKLVIYSLDKKNENDANQWIEFIYPELFLTLIHNAKAVITDSYHGMIFSIIYKKNFINLLRFTAEDPICQNSRVVDLLNILGLEERIVPKEEQERALEIFNELDYIKIDNKLAAYRDKALEFLQNALD